MVKIVSRKSLGIQKVYDIGVETEHNFLLANGLVASNCFNKSHSTAYAYVTYQTAYLKANYPVEYMTALLTANSDNKDKVEKYRENCQKMNIEVKPPDINHSERDFTPIGNQILFGFSAVPTVGEGAIENILNAREKAGGTFKSFADFCQRVDLRVVNSRALETLIYCGAFDKIHNNRKQLIESIELVTKWAQNRAKEKESGQLNLFDFAANNSSVGKEEDKVFETEPTLPNTDDYSVQEKLKLEKEHLGFYVSDHPLKSIADAVQILSPINLSALSEQKSKQKVSAVVMLDSVKKIINKNGNPMAFVQMEDVSGQADGVIFSSTYERIESLLNEDACLIIWGKVERRDDKVQLIVEDAEPVDKVRMVTIELSASEAIDTAVQQKLKSILQERSGEKNKIKVPVVAIINGDRMRQFVRLGQKYWVQEDRSTVEYLTNAGFTARTQSLIREQGIGNRE
ncbi:MAG: OB-fold nucleic acid binding domain-containing protein [Prochloraceae cyanobacterium]|nr:OB-fold nucleic acid binding domain-containing protein [Prochloraceae cyanobacterium]